MTATVGEPFQITNTDTTHVALPAKLGEIKEANDFPSVKLCWNSSEELFSFLKSFGNHNQWFADRIQTRPQNGSMFLFNKQKFKDYRKDGYTWKKRTKTSTTREDHFKRKILGIPCMSALYSHSAIIPTFHRRIYWLLQNPDVVLVHYVNLIEDLTAPDPVHSYVTASKKENILSEVSLMYSGVSPQLIPDIKITEEFSTSCPPSPTSGGAAQVQRSNEKTFKVCITPKPPSSPRRPHKSKVSCQVTKPPQQNSPCPVNNIPQGRTSHWVAIAHHGNTLSQGIALTNQRNSPIKENASNLGNSINPGNIANQMSSPCQVSTWIIPNSRPLSSPYVIRTSGTVTSSINVPIGYRPVVNNDLRLQPPAKETCSSKENATCGNADNMSGLTLNRTLGSSGDLVKTSQHVTTSSSLLNASSTTSPSTFFTSASVGTFNHCITTTQSHIQTGVSLVNSNISRSPLPANEDATALHLAGRGMNMSSMDRSLHKDMSHIVDNVDPPLCFPFSPVSVPTLNRDATELSSKRSTNGGTSNGEIPCTEGCGSSTNSVSEISSRSVSVAAAANSENITSCFGNCESLYSTSSSSLNYQSAAVEPGTSPSSDYGSLISESGTRLSCSGSESFSEIGSQSASQEGIFDGLFRIPRPVPLDNRQPFERCSAIEGSHVFNTPGLLNSQTMDNTNRVANSPLDTHHLAGYMGFDMPELPPLDAFEDGMLNYDLSTVLPEYFSTSDEPLVESCQNRNDSAIHPMGDFSSANNPSKQGQHAKDAYITDPSAASPGARGAIAHSPYSVISPTADVIMTTSDVTRPKDVRDSGGQMNNVHSVRLPSPKRSELHQTVSCLTSSSYQTVTPPRVFSEQGPHGIDTMVHLSSNCSADQTSTASSCVTRVVPESARITDFSPEWSYPVGGVKVLVTGEWSMSDMSYTCLFDGCSVEATLVQIGVLRCYCPSHDPGLVTLQVACNGFIVSNACVFEYRACDMPSGTTTRHEWLAMDEARFKLAMLDRLERLEASLGLPAASNGAVSRGQQQEMTFEQRVMRACRALCTTQTAEDSLAELQKPFRGMTLIHLAAALGFSELVHELITMRHTDICDVIRQEVDPTRKDEFACTPLMWACALGHNEVVSEMLYCDVNTLLIPDARGRMPLQVARDRGYFEVVDCIEEFFATCPRSQSGLICSPLSEDEEDITDSAPGSPPQTSSASAAHHNNTTFCRTPEETTYTDRACSPMAVEEDLYTTGVPLGHALVQVHAMINEAELEADLQSLATRIPGQFSSVHEEAEHLAAAGGRSLSGGRFRSFSSASSQSSPPSSKSSLSPGSPNFLNSPHSSPAVSPDTKEFHEFLCSSKKLLEKNFSELTLTDREQRELYQAAMIIQEAYRSYKTRRQQRDQEMQAAVLIQNHYRRYKQYAVFKKMTQAALIIQNQYRAYREHEQFKKSRRAAAIIQNHFRIYRQRRQSQRRREEYKTKQQEARFMRQASNRSNTTP